MTLQERIAQLRQQIADKVKGMETLYQRSLEEARGFTTDEQKQFDDSKTAIATLEAELKNAETIAQFQLSNPNNGAQGTGAAAAAQSAANGSAVILPANASVRNAGRQVEKGTRFTRYAMALAAAKGSLPSALEIARSRFADTPEVEQVLRAAVAAGTTTDTTWAAPLAVYTDMASEFIELLRPETILGKINGMRRVPFRIRIPRQTSGVSVGWVGQGAPKPVRKQNFDTVTIPHAKMAAIVAITEELARFSAPSAEATVRQDLIETTATFMDQQFIDPAVAAVADLSPGAITNGAPGKDSSGSSVAQITTDLNDAMTAMAVGLLPQRNRYWVLHPRTKNFLMTLRTSQDVFAFRDEMIRGMLMGIPFIESTNMPARDQSDPVSPESLETYIVLVEASEIYLADDGETMLDVSREASLQMDDAPQAGAQSLVSLWQNNLIGIRAERYAYWVPRRAAAVYVISKVAY